jgi:ureidoglycolate lyase
VITLRPETLTAEAFRPFGDVIEASDAYELINGGTTQKFADLATIDVSAEGGRPCVSIYHATPYEMPLTIRMLERHPHGTQLFMPLHSEPFLIVVAPAGDRIKRSTVRAFITNGRQGINYHCGTWHHPLISQSAGGAFLVVDRMGPGTNCEESFFGADEITLHADASDRSSGEPRDSTLPRS